MPSLTIGQVAEQTGVTPDTLRYYERRALLPAPGRSAGGYRQYGPESVRRVQFIRRAQTLGFTLEEIADLPATVHSRYRHHDRVEQSRPSPSHSDR